MKHTYHIHGMTCNGCRSHVEEMLSKVEGVSNATVDLEKTEATIEMESHIPIETFQEALKNDGGRYSIHKQGEHHHTKVEKEKQPKQKVLVHFTVLCIAKVIKLMINQVIVLFVVWTWSKNKIYQQLQQNNGPVQCTQKL